MDPVEKEAQAHLGKELAVLDEMVAGARAHLMLPNQVLEAAPATAAHDDRDLNGVLEGHIAYVRRLQADLRPVVNMLSVLHKALV